MPFLAQFSRALCWRAAIVALLALGLSRPALAEDAGCILDHCADRAPVAAPPSTDAAPSSGAGGGFFRPSGANSSGNFDFYVLALSWSPGFCELKGGDRDQCGPGLGKGFVLHGLWPQFESGFPSDCPGAASPSRMALEHAKDVFPDERLARYEWRKHGTCSGRSPSDYFVDAARAKDSIAIPSPFAQPIADQIFAPIDIERAFTAANPRLRPGMLAIGCRRGVLEDVKICLSKDLREFRACPEVARRGCHGREISVPAPL